MEASRGKSIDTFQAQIYLDREEAHRTKLERGRFLHVVQYPRTRLLGFSLLFLAVTLHNRFILRDLSWPPLVWLGVSFAVYCLLSWCVLACCYERCREVVPLDLVFFTLDMVFWTLAIYASGGERSCLVMILLLRLADQSLISGWRVLGFAGLSMVCYFSMLRYIAVVDGRVIDWAAESTKMTFLVLAACYMLGPAVTARILRERSATAIRVARDLIGQLALRKQQLEEARSRAEEANRLKSEFLRTVGHELRTPLNGVLGLTHLTLQTELTEEQRDNLDLVESSGQQLLTLISNILSFSALAAEQVSLEPATFDPRQVVETVRQGAAQAAADKRLLLHCSVEEEVPRRLIGDAGRLGEMLSHLVDNAVKFTPQGEVEIRAEVADAAEREIRLRFIVSDTGIGIQPEKCSVIFEAFRQADGSTTRAHGGAGLGLSIASHLAHLMGGCIEVASCPDEGTTFTLTSAFERAPRS